MATAKPKPKRPKPKRGKARSTAPRNFWRRPHGPKITYGREHFRLHAVAGTAHPEAAAGQR